MRQKRNNRAKAQSEKVQVTDHAIVRYLERIQGIDIKKVHKAILTRAVRAIGGKGLNCMVPTDNGARVVIKNYRVVTVLGKNQK